MTPEIDAGLSKLTQRLKRTWGASGKVMLDFGYFANVIDLGSTGMAISTDGIGSKAMIASMMERYETVGVDCVAMNVNDLLCVGAVPATMVDYIAVERADADMIDKLSEGLCLGAEVAGISIVGGETAVLGDMISGFDLAGTAVGFVPVNQILQGQNIEKGDVLIGINSNGIHSNGLTLARKVFNLQYQMGAFHCRKVLEQKFASWTLGDELLRQTLIYTAEAAWLIKEIKSLKALLHITGDGLLNIGRVKAAVGFVIEHMPEVPPIFSLIQQKGRIDDATMYSTFNMGIGFCAVVGPEDVANVLEQLPDVRGKQVYQLGHAVVDVQRRIKLPHQKLMSSGNKFERTGDGSQS